MLGHLLQTEYKEQGIDVRFNTNIAKIEKVRTHVMFS